MKPSLTPALARAIAADEANAQMRRAGRKAWNRDDYNLAVTTVNRLLDAIERSEPCTPAPTA